MSISANYLLLFPPPSGGAVAVGLIAPSWLLLLGNQGPPVVLPTSIQGGIIARFNATTALTTAVPGALSPGIPPGATPLPYAAIQSIGERFTYMTGANGTYIEEETFQVSVWATPEEKIKQILLLFMASFNHKAITASPIPLKGGKVFTAYITNARMTGAPGPTKGGNVTYRQMFTLVAKASRVLPS